MDASGEKQGASGEEAGSSASVNQSRQRKVSRRKMVKRPKRRGTYKATKNACDIPIGIGDPDLAECIFSDEEVRADFLDDHTKAVDEGDGEMVEEGNTEGYFTSADIPGTDASNLSSGLEDTSNSSRDSRPSSAASSRPDSSLAEDMSLPFLSETESRPESAASNSSSTVLSDSVSHPGPSSGRTSSASKGKSSAEELHSVLGAIIPPTDVECSPSLQCIESCLKTFKMMLPKKWTVICGKWGFHLLLLTETSPKEIQREVLIHFNGTVSIFVHGHVIMNKKILLNNCIPHLLKEEETIVQEFCEKGVEVVRRLADFRVCVGADHHESENVWHTVSGAYIDLNPYREADYTSTCRSYDCFFLVKEEKRKVNRCEHCRHILNNLKRRAEFLKAESAHRNTPNIFLTQAQSSHKIISQREEIIKLERKVSYLQGKVNKILEQEGVDVEDHISAALDHILKSSELSETQKLFLEQQLISAGKKNPRARRWHPAMIRFALYLKDKTTNSAYEGLRDTGMIQLPSSRTLFDYSHAMAPQDGVSDDILSHVSEKVEKLLKSYQKYHVLLCDEMYTSQNLVYRSSDNALIGYEKLDEVDKEMREFESYVEKLFSGQEVKKEEEFARTMLAYMVKGIASDVKYVVAAFPVKDLTSDMIYVRSWQVVLRLEKAGVKVLVFVCDGAPNNRTFINMHTPITKTKSKVTFDTINFCSPDRRPLFFISDVCHLLKTIRNCLYNSGEGEKKTRCMEISGEKLMWKTIIRLYLTFKDSNFRKSYKLNPQNVFPNKFSCMSVKNAAQVMSDTVAQDIEGQGWEGTKELVRFIRYVNKFFDCLNGAYAGHGIRTKNINLSPYCDVDDPRFDWLGVPNPDRQEPKEAPQEKPFLNYLEDWKTEVYEDIRGKGKEKKLLSHQTLTGIEMAIRGFAGAARFMLKLEEPPKFINARVFSQDPLEQHFSLQRAGGGGSRNPNVSQFLSKQVSIAVQRDLGVRTRKANSTEAGPSGMNISDEPLPKRRKTSKQ